MMTNGFAKNCFVGIDLGTSGCRGIAIDDKADVLAEHHIEYPRDVEQTVELWWKSVTAILQALTKELSMPISHLSVDGTSGTLLLTDAAGNPTSPVLLYNDKHATYEATLIRQFAPPNSGAHGAGSSLAKLVYLQKHYPGAGHQRALHQADWVLGKLLGNFKFSDENNCLKLGYDPVERQWPKWLDKLKVEREWLPEVKVPGSFVGTIDKALAKILGLSPKLRLIAGTTDSIAAFLATGACKEGEAVTSLGSTLAIKLISPKPVFAPEYGVYSHRLDDLWLAGGASNSGGAVLLHYFSRQKLKVLTEKLQPYQPTGLDYYPLIDEGERFPWANPNMQPRLTPHPKNEVQFFQAMLEGIAKIEKTGYQRLKELGAPWPNSIRTVGGGAKNQAWTTIRQRFLKIPQRPPQHSEAAYGAALLAKKQV